MKAGAVLAFGLLLSAPLFDSPAVSAASAPLGGIGYSPLAPSRLLDTRPGFATADGQAAGGGPIGAGEKINLKVTGRGGVPETGVGAVVLNVTAVNQTAPTFITIWPAGSPRPDTSNLNPNPGIIQPNLVIAMVGVGGEISIYNNSGSVDVVADVQGWLPSPLGEAYSPVLPARILETRPGLATIDGQSNGVGAIGPGGTLDLQVTGRAGVPSSGVSAVVLNVTAVNQTAPTFLTLFPTGAPRPNTSNLNPTPGVTAPNLVIAKLNSSGKVTIYNNSGTLDVIADIEGWFPVGPTYNTVDPSRILDSRPGQHTVDGIAEGGGPLGEDSTLTFRVTGRGGIPLTGVGAVVLNVTVTDQTKNTFLTVFPAGSARPEASNLNPTPGLVVPNMVMAKVSPTGEVSIYNHSGTLNVIADVYGWLPSDVVAVDDSMTVAEDAGATVVDVLANDSDSYGLPLSIASSTQPAHGSVVLTGGSAGARTGLTYTPNADYCNTPPGTAPDTFTYMLNGGVHATVSIDVTCVDDAPVAVDNSTTLVEDAPATAINVLANDTDIDGGPKSIQSVTQPAHGTVVITGGGSALTYQPDANYCNAPPGSLLDTFTYTLNGGSVGDVNVTVTCVDDPSTAVDDSASVDEDDAPTAIAVLANDLDVDGNVTIASATQPGDGTVVLTGGQAGARTGLTYEPDPGYCNTPPGTTLDTFTYTLNGGSTATVSVTVDCDDDAPVAVDDSASFVQDSGVHVIDVLANDTDTDGGPKKVQSVTQPADGTVLITGGGSGVSYVSDAGYCNNPPGTVPDTFTYKLNGGSTALVSVTVDCDVPPTAVADSATVNEDAAATPVDVLTNDTDPDPIATPGPKSIQSVTQPANGTVAITGGGSGLTYQPTANYCNTPPGTTLDTFTYTLNGGSSAIVSVTVTCVDDPPTAMNESATVAEDSGATAVLVLVNDTDSDGGPMSVQAVSQPSGGTVLITGGGTGLTYQPATNYCNDPPGTTPDTFTYTLNGGSTATVSMTVTCVDDPPTAVDDTNTVSEDDVAAAFNVLANDTDVDGNVTIASATQPANGTVVLTGGVAGAHTGLTYQPDANYCNAPPGTTPDTFTYTLNGGSTATVFVDVTCLDDAPLSVDDAATFLQDSGVHAVDVLANDTDIDGGPKSVQSVTQPSNGTVAITGGGTGVSYEADLGYCNNPPGTTPDTFTYALNGGSSATVTVTVDCDAPPTAVDDNPTIAEDAVATAIDVLANDTNTDGGPMLVSSTSQPANGTVVITGGGTGLTYQPDANYCNTPPGTTPDTFTYTLTPGTSTATVSVSVTCVDDPPVAVADTATVNEDVAATAVDVLTNDTDIDLGPRSVQSVTQPANGTVVITGGGTGLTYKPNANYCNNPPGTSPDTFTYTLVGGSGTTVSMTVTCVNDAPVADDEAFSGASTAIGNTTLVVNDPTDGAPSLPANQPHKSISGDILAGDTDVDGPGPLTVTAGTFSTANGGSVTIESDGDFTFFPKAATSCTDTSDSFDYTVSDQSPGTPGTDTGTVTVSLAGCVWYVDNSSAAASSGTAAAPFHTIAEAETASAAGSTVFVFDGLNTTAGYDTGFALKSTQRLIGEPADLVVDVDGGGAIPPDTLHNANPAARPTITATDEDVVALDDGNDVRGIAIDPQGTGGGIAGGSGDVGGTIDDVFIDDNGTPGARPGLELDSTSGTFNISNLTVDNGGSATAIGVRLNNAGTVNFLSAGTISVTTDGAKALDITGTNMGTSAFDSVTATNSGTGGISIVNATGSTALGDGSGTDVSVTTTSGSAAGVRLSASTNVTIPGVTADVSATGGPAVDIANGSGSYSFDVVSSTNSANDGINLDGLGTGTFSAASGGITGATGIAVDVNGGSGNISYPGNIGNGSGQSAEVTGRTGGVVTLSGNIADTNDVGGGINLSGNSGGSTVFSGGLKTINTGSSSAILMGSSDNHTLTFSGGGLDVDTTSGKGIEALNSGTLIITGAGNSITSGSGNALNVTNTDIGTGGINFVSVSSNGAASGITLTNTGGTAGLTVGGGVIQNSTDNGVSVNGTRDLNLSSMSILNNGNGLDEGGLRLIDLTGTGQLTSSTVSGSYESNVYLANSAGTLTSFTIHGPSCSITNNNAAQGNTGISVLSTLTANMTVVIDNCMFQGNRTDSILADSADASTLTSTITNNTIIGGSPNTGNIGIDVTAAATSHHNFLVNANKIGTDGSTPSPLLNHGINVFAGNSSTVTGKVTNNIVHLMGAGSSGTGIRLFVSESGKINSRVASNTVDNVGLDFGIDATNNGNSSGASTGTLNVAVVNNNSSTQPAAIYAIRVRGRRDTTTCAAITGNTATTNGGLDGISVSQANTAIFNIEAPPAGPITDAVADTRLTGLNTSTVAASSVSDDFTAVNTNSCPLIPS